MTPISLKTTADTYRGFTLVELLLGLAITAIIGLCVYNIFWSAMRLDDKMRHVHDVYMELLMADQAMTLDLENAIRLDLSSSYPDAVNFAGQSQEFSFLTQTPKGIRYVRYYSGLPGQEAIVKRMIGRITNPSNPDNASLSGVSVEFLVRQESSLADWLNQTSNDTSSQIVASGIKKGSFSCQYAPFAKDLHTSGAAGVVYQDTWDDAKKLPMAVSCKFTLFDPKKPKQGLSFRRDIFLAPVAKFYNEQ